MAVREGAEVKKKTSTQRQKEEEKRERMEKLNAQKASLGSRLAAVDALLSGYSIPDLQGPEVDHTQYGRGTVILQKEGVITVRYGETEKKQKLPFVVAGGFMQLPDTEMAEKLVQMDDLNRQKAALVKEINYIGSLLGDLEKI